METVNDILMTLFSLFVCIILQIVPNESNFFQIWVQ